KYLGCGAHLKSLRRLSCGLLTLDQALPVSAVEARGDQEKIPLISLSRALDFLRGLRLSDPVVARLRMGRQEALSGLPAPEAGEGMMRLLDSQDGMVALARWVDDAAGGRWRLFRVFGC
ncbi:MAG: hypothetical protein HYV05_10150, partial [Deltaproteobacteria bacterium]|nr:hypothetical protein [Deltaproteobacteria bacterium]